MTGALALFDVEPAAPATRPGAAAPRVVPADPAPAGPAAPAGRGGNGPLYVIELPPGMRLLNANERLHHRPKGVITADLREAAAAAVVESRELAAALDAARPGPVFHRAHVLGVLRPATKGRRDPANWYPTFKAMLDGVVDAGVLEDDDHTRVDGPDMRLGRKVKHGQAVLILRGLEPGERWPDWGVSEL
ncbi:hypothetical protein VSR01_16595 [Actinacidiphila sp. DG2A-62]|uniref:hypothetical protein n=1 Tax=Actinacidiphila sp. DG2A-62 TaxID=3108821 RepID=UPI002DBF4A83|nr:hypothetical protein [Actinacidiphila sp. DG2A-62]MEC3995066.1 hypothetical protein [Actinacidiphila sp. DG2A-62]